MQKLKLVISDFHLSRGKWLPDGRRNPLEDFHQDQRLFEMLDHYSSGPHADSDVELIVNGDFFDPLAVIPVFGQRAKRLEFPIEVEEEAAVKQFRTIFEGHPIAFNGMKLFLQRGKRIVFRWGNHDAAILWPGVQAFLRESLAAPSQDQLSFQQLPYIFDRICVDHGHQYEVFNQFDDDNIFITRDTPKGRKKILNLPFGSFFVMGFLNRIKIERSYINQVYPLRLYVRLAMFIEPFFFTISGFKALWFFIKMRFITHPMRFARFRKTLALLGEVVRRPSLEEEAEKILCGPGAGDLPFDTNIMGHNHQAMTRVFPGGKQYINTGTWIPITSLEMSTLGHKVLRTYALIEYVDGRARSSLKIWNGSPQVTEDFA